MNYAEMKGIRFSELREMRHSPAHYRRAVGRADEPGSGVQALGSAVHVAVLEPERYAREYATYPGPVRRGKAWEEWRAEHEGCTIVTETERETVARVADAVRAHSIAADLLRGGSAEVCESWVDATTGLACRGRVDFITATGSLLELKTARDSLPRAFARAAAAYAYHAQVAWYSDGFGTVGSPRIVAVSTGPEPEVVVYRVPEDAIAAGRALYQSWLRRVRECTDREAWPGPGDTEVDLLLPSWALAGGDGGGDVELTVNGESEVIS